MKKLNVFLLIVFIFSTVLTAAEKSDKKKNNKKESSEQYLLDLDASKDEATILKAIDFVGSKKKSKALPKLMNLLGDQRDQIRLNVCATLGLLENKKAIPTLNKIVLEDSSSDVRYSALLAIVRIGVDDSVRTLEKLKNQETDPIIKDFLAKLEGKSKGKKGKKKDKKKK